jgi:hypothetical protein
MGFILIVLFLLFINYVTGFSLIGLSILVLAIAVMAIAARD